MNTYYKFAPNVFLAKCDEKHEKGETIEVTTKYGKENESIVFNLIFEKDGFTIIPSLELTALMFKNGLSKERNAGMNGRHRQYEKVMSIFRNQISIVISFLWVSLSKLDTTANEDIAK